MRKRSIEPLLWILFSAGGVLAALFLPVLLALFGLGIPLGWVAAPSRADLLATLDNPLTRGFLFLLGTLSLLHSAHRLRYTLYDGLQIKHLNGPINLVCYGGAILGSLATGFFLWWSP